jgi:hypothetical protein
LQWQLQWGGRIEFLQDLAKSGEEVPALKNRPTLTMWQRFFWDAYHVVNSSRNFHSAGLASIPLSEILAYFQIYNIRDLELRDLYIQHIQTLDNTYLEHANKRTS